MFAVREVLLRVWIKSGSRLLGGAVVLLAGAAAAAACAFHTYLPEKTMVDHLLAAELVVAARPSPDDPFRFAITETLRGSAEAPSIPHLANSPIRRRLAMASDHAVLFAYDEDTGAWTRAAYLDPVMREVVGTVLASADRWAAGDDADRVQLAARLLDSNVTALRRLALGELDRVPYPVLRDAGVKISGEAIAAELWRIDQMAFVPIRALLLGLAGGDTARTLIHSGVEQAAKGSPGWLGPWATALVEIDGTAGVKKLASLFLHDRAQSNDARALVVEAFAIHRALGPPPVTRAIDRALRDAMNADVALRAVVARRFAMRKDFSQVAPIKAALATGPLPSAAQYIAMARYVSLAKRRGQP